MRRAALALAALAAVLAVVTAVGARPAAADSTVDAAVAALRDSPVYSAPDADPGLTDAEVGQLADQVAGAGTPIYIAVLPASVLDSYGGSPNNVIRAIQQGLGRDGTYALVYARNLRVGNNQGHDVSSLADAALASNQHGTVYGVLSSFVANVADSFGSAGGGSSGSAGISGPLVVGGLLVAGAGGVFLLARRSSKRAAERAAANLAEVRPAAEEDVTQLGEDIDHLDLDIDAPQTTEEMRQHYAAALNAYDAAKTALDRATSTADLEAVTTALEEGRYEMACVRALQAGDPVPERRPPCFFNPQHGPSVTDVTWTPAGGSSREVPVCQQCADRLARGDAVDARTVSVGGQPTEYWNAGPQYAGYAGGYLRGNGGMLPGILIGTVLGSSLGGWGGGWYGGGGGGFYGGGYDGGAGGGGGGDGWSFGGGGFDGGGGGGFDGGGGGGDGGGGSF